jgi:hypothetical protein
MFENSPFFHGMKFFSGQHVPRLCHPFIMFEIMRLLFDLKSGRPDEFRRDSLKMWPNPFFCQNQYISFSVEKISETFWLILNCFTKLPKVPKQSPHGRKFAQSGVGALITFFCDFLQFLTLCLKTNLMIKFLHN